MKCCNLLFFGGTTFPQAASSTSTSSSDFLHFPRLAFDDPQRRALSVLHLCRWREIAQYVFLTKQKSDWRQYKSLCLLSKVKYQNLTPYWCRSGIKLCCSCTQGHVWSSGCLQNRKTNIKIDTGMQKHRQLFCYNDKMCWSECLFYIMGEVDFVGFIPTFETHCLMISLLCIALSCPPAPTQGIRA